MEKYTCENWLRGDAQAVKECFSTVEWEKLMIERKNIYLEN